MSWVSTRGTSPAIPLSDALTQGLAPDGGLYVPEYFPPAPPLRGDEPFAEAAAKVLAPIFAGDRLAPRLPAICAEAFGFPLPLVRLDDTSELLELFHGPTAAFKDVGARFLAGCLSELGGPERTIVVATSGDTGGAVAAAFHRRPGFRVLVLFPKDGVSGRQRQQLTSFGDNVTALAVRGSFDDCQRLVKQALSDPALAGRLASANSINIGRLLPQMAYYAAASSWYRKRHGQAPGFVVPSGNIGNASGALWAKRMGFPVRRIVLATNANRAVPDYFEKGEWKPRASLATLANAMDVGQPSNMERVFHLYGNDRARLKADAGSVSVSDAEIRETIRTGEAKYGQVFCPHTAVAVHAREGEPTPHWIAVATAHPAKFETVVEPLVGHAVALPPELARILSRPSHCDEIAPEYPEVSRRLLHPR